MDHIALLIPGSIWVRERKNKQIFSTVVCITNSHIPEEKKAGNPEQVVYLDSRGRYNSLPIETFLRNRTYHDMNPTVANNVENILVEPEDLNFSDSNLLEDDLQESEATLEESAEGQQEGSRGVTFVMYDAAQPPALSQSVLDASLSAYHRLPVLEANAIQHQLIFELGSGITIDQLREAFSAASEASYCAMVVNGELVEWETCLGVYPMYTPNEDYAIVVFRTNAVVEVSETIVDDIVESQPHEELADAAPSSTEPSEMDTAPAQTISVQGEITNIAAPGVSTLAQAVAASIAK